MEKEGGGAEDVQGLVDGSTLTGEPVALVTPSSQPFLFLCKPHPQFFLNL